MCDVDFRLWFEYSPGLILPLAIFETALYKKSEHKDVEAIRNFAMCFKPVLPAFLVFYELADYRNPAETRSKDILRFRVKKLWPDEIEKRCKIYTPAAWANQLVKLHGEMVHKVRMMPQRNHRHILKHLPLFDLGNGQA